MALPVFTPRTWKDETSPLGPPENVKTATEVDAASLTQLEETVAAYALELAEAVSKEPGPEGKEGPEGKQGKEGPEGKAGGAGGATTGKGEPKSLEKGAIYFQVNEAEEVIACWIGTSGSPLKVAEFTGIPAAGSVTAAKIGNIGAGTRFWPRGYTYTPGSYKPGAKTAGTLPLYIPEPCTITGLQYEVGEVSNGKVLLALFTNSGEQLGKSASASQSAAFDYQRVAFEAPAVVTVPGIYWPFLMMESATGTWWGAANGEPWSVQTEGSFAVPASIVPPTTIVNTGAKAPYLSTY